MSKYTSGFDYNGRMCGHDICDNGEVCGDFIYFCSNLGESGIDTFHPICIDSCPTSNLTSHLCYDEASMGPLLVKDWPTKEYGMKCLQRSHRVWALLEHISLDPTIVFLIIPFKTQEHLQSSLRREQEV